MRRLSGLVLLLLLPAAPAFAVDPSVVVHHLSVRIVVHRDGTASLLQHEERSPSSEAAAARIGQFPLDFNPSLERLEILEGATLKAATADQPAARIAIDPSRIQSQLAPGIADVPIFQDIQNKVVIFPDLRAGDTESLTFRRDIDKPLFRGQFLYQRAFIREYAWEDVRIDVAAPADYPLHVEALGDGFSRDPPAPAGADGLVHAIWHYRQTEVAADDIAAVSGWDRLPRIFVSSFAGYDALAAAYAAGSAGRAAVTPDIQARADAIVGGITDRRDQARALYDWVSTHIRYVAVYLGAGGVEPHAAGAVLAAGYGDCKDHVVLFEALLRARGIEAVPVLINNDVAYTLSTAPTIAQLNHVISYIPEFDLYADTTAGVAPFGTLPFPEYGKPAVRVGFSPALMRMRLLAPDEATVSVRTQAHIDLDGAIIGTTVTDAVGPFAVALRLLARNVQALGHEAAARRNLAALGEAGVGRYLFTAPDAPGSDFSVRGTFTLEPQPEILEGDSFAPPFGLQLLIRPGDYLLGPLGRTTLPESEPTPCFAGRESEALSLELPQGRRPVRLPRDRSIETADFTYTAHWQLDGQTVTVRRELVSRIAQPTCSGELRHAAAAALKEIRRDHRAKIVLADP